MNNNPAVSVIFVNYNTKNMTVDAINSVLDKTKDVEFEIIVVDNASSDGSSQLFDEIFGNRITAISSNENLGFAGGNNFAIKQASGKYIFLLNTDTLLINNAVKILYDFMEANPDAGVCGGNLYNQNGEPSLSVKFKPLKRRNSALFDVLQIIKGKILNRNFYNFNYSGRNMEVACVTGADMMIRKSVLEETGLFDPDFFMYGEETELENRIHKKGYKSYSVPSAKITHLEQGSVKNSEKHFSMAFYGSCMLYEKVFGKGSVYLFYRYSLRFELLVCLFTLKIKRYIKRKKIIKEQYCAWKVNRGR